jgi:hypothetical protein
MRVSRAFIPESSVLDRQVFWLAPVCSTFPAFLPVDTLQHLAGLTAAGTAPEFNRIPLKHGGTFYRAGDRF